MERWLRPEALPSGGTLHACVNEEGGLRLLKAGKRCKKGQTAVVWDQTGPAGAKGALGAPGAAGGKGAEGPKGAPSESANVKWASIGAAGEIEATHGVLAALATSAHYYVAFDSDITNCAVTATSNQYLGLAPTVVRAGTEVTVYFYSGGASALTSFSIVAIC